MKHALAAGDLSMGHWYYEGYENRIARRRTMQDEAIPTLIKDLDRAMNGGLRRKELGVLMGPPGRGKTLGLIHMAKAASLFGKSVVFYTCEMSEDRIADRLDSSLSGVPLRKLRSEGAEVSKKLKGLVRPEKLIIKEWPMKKATPNMLRAHMDGLIGNGNRPDLMIVDYGDILASARKYQDRRHEVASNFAELRAMGAEYDIAVWTGTQANRKSLSKENVTVDDIAESFEKVAISDVIIGLCQTGAEREDSMLRLFIAKNRDNPSVFSLKPHYCDFARMRFYCDDTPENSGEYTGEKNRLRHESNQQRRTRPR